MNLDTCYFLACVSFDHHPDSAPIRTHRREVGDLAELGSPATTVGFDRYLDDPRQADLDDPSRYRRPAALAMLRLAGEKVHDGYPDRCLTLQTLVKCGGDIDQAAAVLARRFPAMGNPDLDFAHFAKAISRFGRMFRVERKQPA